MCCRALATPDRLPLQALEARVAAAQAEARQAALGEERCQQLLASKLQETGQLGEQLSTVGGRHSAVCSCLCWHCGEPLNALVAAPVCAHMDLPPQARTAAADLQASLEQQKQAWAAEEEAWQEEAATASRAHAAQLQQTNERCSTALAEAAAASSAAASLQEQVQDLQRQVAAAAGQHQQTHGQLCALREQLAAAQAATEAKAGHLQR